MFRAVNISCLQKNISCRTRLSPSPRSQWPARGSRLWVLREDLLALSSSGCRDELGAGLCNLPATSRRPSPTPQGSGAAAAAEGSGLLGSGAASTGFPRRWAGKVGCSSEEGSRTWGLWPLQQARAAACCLVLASASQALCAQYQNQTRAPVRVRNVCKTAESTGHKCADAGNKSLRIILYIPHTTLKNHLKISESHFGEKRYIFSVLSSVKI